jgi:DNA-binding NarL/FixJ family response regulator
LVETHRGNSVDVSIGQNPPNDRSAAAVLVVDDQPVFRAVLRRVVDGTAALVVVGEADSGEGAVEMTRSLEPDLVLMDVRMPGIGGLAAAKQIKELQPEVLVILVSTTHPEHLVDAATACDADAAVWKSDLCPRLLEGLWRTHSTLGN